ncbi:MAG: hypothetical protein M3N18_07655 [Actinomycetota bacterium]|nr:hypothetical protein [Actinomycetota bacterium]
MQHIHSMPNPRALGYKWPEWEKAQTEYANIKRRQAEANQKRRDLELEVNRLTASDRKRLKESWAAGEGDTPEDSKLAKLKKELAAQERIEATLREVAMPEAEGKLLTAASQNARDRWAPEIEANLPERLSEVREAIAAAQEAVSAPMRQLLQEAALLDWCESGFQVYSPPADITTPSAFQQISEHLEVIERKLAERAQEREEGGVA